MNLTIHCPHCGQHYELDNFREGADVQCGACLKYFTLSTSLVDTNPSVRDVEEPQRAKPKATKVSQQAVPLTQFSNPPASQQTNIKGGPPAFHSPILSLILYVLAGLEIGFLVAFILIALIMKDFKYALFAIPAVLIPLIKIGIAQLINHIGQIRHHAIRQTELLTQIRDSLAAQASNGEGNSHDM